MANTSRPASGDRPERSPVPLNVLLPPAATRHVPAAAATDPTAGLSAAAASRLVSVYTRPGDLVLDVHGTGTLAAAAARADRHGLTLVTHSRDRHRTRAATHAHLDPRSRTFTHTIAVPARDVPAVLAHHRAHAQLLLTRLPSRPSHRLSLRQAAQWLTACRTALRDDGWLIASVDPSGSGGTFHDHATTVIVAARAAGLTYHQHLVTITRLPHTDQSPARLPAGHRHERIHADLFVFTHERLADA